MNQSEFTEKNLRSPLLGAHGSDRALLIWDVKEKPKHSPLEWSAGPKIMPAPVELDLLSMVDPERHGEVGEWNRSGTEINLVADKSSMLRLPADIRDSYELEVEFTRSSGRESVDIVLPLGHSWVKMFFSYGGGKLHAIESLDGKAGNWTKHSVQPGRLENGRKYAAWARIRVAGENGAVEIELDGKRLIEWEGKIPDKTLAKLGVSNPWQAGLGGNKSEITFHRATLRMLDGHAAVREKKPSAR